MRMMKHTLSLSRTASWVIRETATKRVICETFEPEHVAKLNVARYEAVPILDYLRGLNKPKTK